MQFAAFNIGAFFFFAALAAGHFFAAAIGRCEPVLYQLLFAAVVLQGMCALSQVSFILRGKRGAFACAIAWARTVSLVRSAGMVYLAVLLVALSAAFRLHLHELAILACWGIGLTALNHLVLQPATIRVLQGRRLFARS